MRKFAIIPLFLSLSLAQVSFAQVRDLFAEFEQEATVTTPVAASSTSVAPSIPEVKTPATPESSASVPASSAVKAPASSSSKKTKKSKSSSSKTVSSSSAEIPLVSSSSILLSSSTVEVSSSSEGISQAVVGTSSSVVTVESSSSIADSVPSVAVADTSVLDSAARDSLMRAVAVAEADKVRAQADSSRRADSLAQAQAAGLTDMSSSSAASSNSMSRRELLGPVKVSKVHGIDELKGRYKNPRKALFLSLLVPGVGQMYVGGSTATYVRGGVYMALEVFMWSGWGYFSIYKYNQQVDKYKKFAKQHYSIGRYERNMRNLYDNTDADLYGSEFNNRYMGTRKSFCEAIYGNAGYGGCYHENALFSDDRGHVSNFVSEYDRNHDITLADEIKNIRNGFDKESEVFQLISEGPYVLGWDDADSLVVAQKLGLEKPNSETVALGKSSNLNKYRDMRSDANDYADMQAWFIGGLILNHIVSAVDAALTANAHNKVLYEEDVSWYDRLHFESGMSFTDSFGWSVRANWGF